MLRNQKGQKIFDLSGIHFRNYFFKKEFVLKYFLNRIWKLIQINIYLHKIFILHTVQVSRLMSGDTQEQIYAHQDLQTKLEIQFYVLEDLANFLGMLIEVLQVYHFLKSQYKDHPYIPVSINRLIVQTNLSQAINFDCFHHYSKTSNEIYKAEKAKAFKILNKYLSELSGEYYDQPQIQNCVQFYKSIFLDQQIINQQELLPTEREINFDYNVVEKIMSGMQSVDQIKKSIQNGTYKNLISDDIQNQIKKRQQQTQILLEQQFSKSIQKLA